MPFQPGQHVRIKRGAKKQFLGSDGTFSDYGESIVGAPEIAFAEYDGYRAEVKEPSPAQPAALISVAILKRASQVEKATAFYRPEDLVAIRRMWR